jgi:hypothetical protein
MSCYQLLKLNSNSADLSIDQGNVVNLAEVIKRFSVKTPVLDFKLAGNVLQLYSRNELGVTELRQVILQTSTGNSSVAVSSTSTIGSVIQNGIITSSVKVSQTVGNKILINNDGLFVDSIETPITANDSTSINFHQTDTLGHIMSASVNISAFAGNALILKNDGLYVSVSSVTTSFIRGLLTANAPIVYDSSTGVFSIPKATTSVDGYLGSTDWNTFNTKANTVTALGTGTNLFKQKTGVNLEFKSIKAGIGGISLVTSGDDILINNTNLAPSVNAGSAQTILASGATTSLAGAIVPNTGTTVSGSWLFLSGPSVPTLSDYGVVNPVVTGLNSVGSYKFRLIGINSIGLANTGDVSINVISGGGGGDTIYYSAQSSATPPNASAVAAGATFSQNGAIDVPIDWTSFNSAPLFCWAAIPALGGTYPKNYYYMTSINNGHIGDVTDLFPAPTQVTISSIVYNVYFTSYPTQFTDICQLKNAP